MAGGTGAASFTVAPESTGTLGAQLPSSTTFAAGVSGRPLWPSDITGLVLWLPADQIQGIASGTSLSNWTDSSTSASHATQPSAVSQGVFLINVQNGLGGVVFGNGIGQALTSPTSIVDVSTLCIVTSSTSGGLSQRPLGATVGSSTRIVTSGGNWAFARAASGASSQLNDGLATVAWKSIIGFADVSAQSVCTLTVNGQTFLQSVTTSAVSGTLAGIGAASPSASTYSGVIGEVCVFSRNLVDVERVSLDSYFRTKWGTG